MNHVVKSRYYFISVKTRTCKETNYSENHFMTNSRVLNLDRPTTLAVITVLFDLVSCSSITHCFGILSFLPNVTDEHWDAYFTLQTYPLEITQLSKKIDATVIVTRANW